VIPWPTDLPGRALEIGCGQGELLCLLRLVGWDAEGVDGDAHAVKVAIEVSGCPVQVGDFRDVQVPAASFQLVFLNHVFEHIDSPRSVFELMSRALRQGGRGVLVYPNPESLGARIYRRDWMGWEPPRHLVLPTVRAIRLLAKSVGLHAPHIRSLCREASHLSCSSRARRKGLQAERVDVLDRGVALLERVGNRSLRWGEELVITLEKR
jgi:SAM-dependent methyltransferase